jgi:hypothetical protein
MLCLISSYLRAVLSDVHLFTPGVVGGVVIWPSMSQVVEHDDHHHHRARGHYRTTR